jgi:hypothetical protein
VQIRATGYVGIDNNVPLQPGETITQDVSLNRVVLTTYQQTVNAGAMVNLGNLTAGASGLRMTLLNGASVTVGLSNDGMTFTGTPETLTGTGVITDRSLAELGGAAAFVMAQNNTPMTVDVRVEVLG